MARSLKKGPFADASLLKKIDAANASGDKTVIKTLVPPFYYLSRPSMGHTRSRYTMEESMFRYMLPRTW